jgi:hypothetical protein
MSIVMVMVNNSSRRALSRIIAALLGPDLQEKLPLEA